MLTVLAAATVEAAHDAAQAAGESGAAELIHRFGIQPGYVAMQFVSFAILAFVLYRFAIKPTLATMDERNAKIADGLKNAEATASRLEEAQKEAAALVQQARVDADKVIADARQLSKELAEREAAAATERANALITKAEASIQLEHKKMLDEARVEIARLVVATTRQVLAKELSAEEQSRYNQAAARELTTL
ncbi:MAG: F0F1 ATP synthase subunit B [Verrucomicrobiota bacterium]|jgi:F-type H+-transporting ATPase subunit b